MRTAPSGLVVRASSRDTDAASPPPHSYSSYNYDPIRRSSFDEHVNAIYAAVAARSAGKPVDIDPQRLALFFQILATGCQSSLEFSPSDPISDFYHGLAQCCLALGQFMQKPTLAACQALVRSRAERRSRPAPFSQLNLPTCSSLCSTSWATTSCASPSLRADRSVPSD